jgi:hypothetical protein
MTELSEAVSEKEKIVVVTKMVLNLMKQMAARVHRPLKVTAFNATDIWRQRYELSKQLQGLHIDVAVLSETHFKPHERFRVPNYNFYRTDGSPVSKGIPHNDVDMCDTYT